MGDSTDKKSWLEFTVEQEVFWLRVPRFRFTSFILDFFALTFPVIFVTFALQKTEQAALRVSAFSPRPSQQQTGCNNIR